MRRLIMVLALGALVLGATACSGRFGNTVVGSGNVKTETRQVSGFTELELAGIGTVNVQQGANEALTIEAEDNIIPHLRTDVQNGRLTVGTEPNINLRPGKSVIFNVTMKNITALRITGSGDIKAPAVKTDKLDLRLSGSGNLTVDSLTANAVTTDLSGSGNITVAGTAPQQTLDISGSGAYQADRLTSNAVQATVSGSGRATVNATGTLDVRISGSGNVDYLGDPKITQQISGSGKLTKKQ